MLKVEIDPLRMKSGGRWQVPRRARGMRNSESGLDSTAARL